MLKSNDHKPYTGVKPVRAAPPSNLKQPVRPFSDTFSAEKVLVEKFFKDE